MACGATTDTPGGRPATRTYERLQLLVLKLGGQRERSLDQTSPRDTEDWNRCTMWHELTMMYQTDSALPSSEWRSVPDSVQPTVLRLFAKISDIAAVVFLAHILVYSVAEHKQNLPNYPLFENISVSQPSHLCPCNPPPLSRDSFKTNCEDQMFGNSVLAFVFWQNLRFYFGKGIWDSRLDCGRFFPTEI